ncbi:tetratricopeptide repeat protein [Opacimonas viscosa]|uniref:Tetratricopeptide repeat protein n=1 Tax=Opacimonas viscosa TaxID=2961944 RepID=A0AA42BMP6_9ALTE|nr:hypothetical protein [Opacimonas viscosa]MCP3428857.1 hypothetical protein [Opacimonas viscosa]
MPTVLKAKIASKIRFIAKSILCLLFLFTAGVTANTNTNEAVFTAVEQHLDKGETKQAMQLLQSIEHDAEANIQLALLVRADDLDDAEDYINKAVQLEPDNANAFFIRGLIMGQQASQSIFSAMSYAKKSLESFEKAVALEPKNAEYRIGLFTFYIEALPIAGGDDDKALEQVAVLESLDPKRALIAKLQLATKQEDSARIDRLIQEGQTVYPEDVDILFNAAMIKQNQKDYTAALSIFQDLAKISLTPENQDTLLSAKYQFAKTTILANREYAQGLQAIEFYLEQTTLPDSAEFVQWAKFRKANILEGLGQNSEAKLIYTKLSKSDIKRLKKEAKKALKRV